MEIRHKIYDNRIDSLNLLIETTIGEYFALSSKILDKNHFQRRRVKSSSTVYSLLKTDLRLGCVVPPIVLALSIDARPKEEVEDSDLIDIVVENNDKLIILDGLQRTYTIRELVNEINEFGDPEKDVILARKLRIEIYIGINKLGILYRMLTLNTGQTAMSSRHQIEIIYSDYIDTGVNGIRLIKEVEGETPNELGEYNFRDIIQGFTSYLDRDFLTIDRTDILDNIKSLEKLAVENKDKDLFIEYLTAYDSFVKKIVNLSENLTFDETNLDGKLSGQPFGKNTLKIFNKSQVMTGFGSAIGKLIDFKGVKDVTGVRDLINDINFNNAQEDINNLLIKLDSIKIIAKKIGNDQRLYFHLFFENCLIQNQMLI